MTIFCEMAVRRLKSAVARVENLNIHLDRLISSFHKEPLFTLLLQECRPARIYKYWDDRKRLKQTVNLFYPQLDKEKLFDLVTA